MDFFFFEMQFFLSNLLIIKLLIENNILYILPYMLCFFAVWLASQFFLSVLVSTTGKFHFKTLKNIKLHIK